MRRFEDILAAGQKPWAGGYLYLASVFRKHKDGLVNAYLEAQKAQAVLWKAGVNVFSPIACFYPTAQMHSIHLTKHSWWITHDLPYMRGARGLIILMQDGWQESNGISDERQFFEERNSGVYSLDFPVKLDV